MIDFSKLKPMVGQQGGQQPIQMGSQGMLVPGADPNTPDYFANPVSQGGQQKLPMNQPDAMSGRWASIQNQYPGAYISEGGSAVIDVPRPQGAQGQVADPQRWNRNILPALPSGFHRITGGLGSDAYMKYVSDQPFRTSMPSGGIPSGGAYGGAPVTWGTGGYTDVGYTPGGTYPGGAGGYMPPGGGGAGGGYPGGGGTYPGGGGAAWGGQYPPTDMGLGFSNYPSGPGYTGGVPMGYPEGQGTPAGFPWYEMMDFTRTPESYRVPTYAEQYPGAQYGTERPQDVTNIQFPPEWGVGSEALTQLARGMPTDIPQPWATATELAQSMAETGAPTPIPDIWQRGGGRADIMAETGLPTPVPQAWEQAQATAGQMAETGMPFDTGAWWEAQQPVAERFMKEQSQQAMEEAGLTGLRMSTPAQRTIADITGKTTENLWSQLMGRDIASQEAARGRQLQATQALTGIGGGIAGLAEAARGRQLQAFPMQYQYGAGEAGLGEAMRGRQAGMIPQLGQMGMYQAALPEAAKGRALTAAQALGPMGQFYAQLPQQIAQGLMGTAGAMQGARQQQIAPIMAEFMRRLPENAPWIQQAMGLLSPSGMFPQQYQPSGASQALGAGTDIATILAMLKMGAAASSIEFKKDVENLTEQDEEAIAEKMAETPLFNYRYKFETNETVPHLGPITETSPQEFTLFDNKAVGLAEYISALHATIKTLTRRVKVLEEK